MTTTYQNLPQTTIDPLIPVVTVYPHLRPECKTSAKNTPASIVIFYKFTVIYAKKYHLRQYGTFFWTLDEHWLKKSQKIFERQNLHHSFHPLDFGIFWIT